MKSVFNSLEPYLPQRVRDWKAAGKLKPTTLRLFLLWIVFAFLGLVIKGWFGTLFSVLGWVCAVFTVLYLLGTIYRWVFNRVLWTVRARLIVTCLLLGLAPIILFGALAAIAAYLFCGQFATSIALEGIKDNLTRVQERGANVLNREALANPSLSSPPQLRAEAIDAEAPLLKVFWYDGKPVSPAKSTPDGPFASAPAPAWLHPGFKGMITTEAGEIFLCSVSAQTVGPHTLSLLACSPFRSQEMGTLAEGLGNLRLATHGNQSGDDSDDNDKHKTRKYSTQNAKLKGGTLAPPINVFDIPVFFSAPVSMQDWPSGDEDSDWLIVVSRPAILYNRLFASSLDTGAFVKISLIVAGAIFGSLEFLAILMAFGLSRTITHSIADLYDATREIDRGNLDHHIPVRRKDQLAALAGSFNTMTTSLKGLLEAQREKDRMQNELEIAQEVQNNLFPHSSVALPNFEVYGLSEPARTIGGDYYDFIPFGTSSLYLSLGDISGKGISAALLMASLHSAVRAYRGSESSESTPSITSPGDFNLSPGHLLALLNNHLYSSTQAAKYATLFLACYDNDSRLLTYSNGGHLPPILLCCDGQVKRLECGGSVVGLLENMHYDEATIQLSPGDLLIAFSDGLTEPEKDGIDFGDDRLIAEIRRHQILPLNDIATKTMNTVKDWIGDEEQPDDMTLVLARLT